MAGKRRPIIAVFGGGDASVEDADLANYVGGEVAKRGFLLLCGGRGGVMYAAAKGAKAEGGQTLAVVMSADPNEANEYIDIVLASGMGDARNAILANSADACVAIGGSYGTLSEIAYAAKREKPIALLRTWALDPQRSIGKSVESFQSKKGLERWLDGLNIS